jgi:hypothetical protein
MSPGRAKFVTVLLVLAVAGAGGGMALRARADAESLEDEPVVTQSHTVVAQTRSISSVLVLEGTVVANPLFRVAAPVGGTVVLMSKKRVGVRASLKARPRALKLPKDSHAVNFLVEPGTRVKAGVPVVDAQLSGFALQARVPAEKLYRLYEGASGAKGEITNGPGPFECRLLGVPFVPGSGMQLSVAQVAAERAAAAAAKKAAAKAAAIAASQEESVSTEATVAQPVSQPVVEPATAVYSAALSSDEGSLVVCSAPAGLTLIEGMPCLIALTTAQTIDAVSLPVEAVAGISQRGQVYVVRADGAKVIRDVELGITDGTFVQVTSGIEVGDTIAVPSPSIAALRR